MGTKHLFVLIHIRNKGRGWYRETCLSPPFILLLAIQRRYFLCGSILLCDCLCHIVLNCLYHAALWSPAWKRADFLALLYVMYSCVFSLFHSVSMFRCGT